MAKQLSVFIENRQGRLGEVLRVLKENNVNILSLSLADTTEYGLLRLIVNNPDLGKEKLVESGFSTMLTKVFVVKIGHSAGSLQQLVSTLSLKGISVEYMYGLSTEKEDAFIVLKLSDAEKASAILKDCGVATLSSEEIANI